MNTRKQPKRTLAYAVADVQSAWAALLSAASIGLAHAAENCDLAACEAHDEVDTPNGPMCAACMTRWPCTRFFELNDRLDERQQDRKDA